MRQRIPDIKTVDTFFEIFSDPKKFQERMAEMRAIRDEISAGLDKKLTKEKADQLLRQAQNTIAEARAMADEAIATKTTVEKEVGALRKKQKDHAKTQNDQIAEKRRLLTDDEADLQKQKTAFEKTTEAREKAVSEREDSVESRETNVLTRENAVADWAQRMEKAAAKVA